MHMEVIEEEDSRMSESECETEKVYLHFVKRHY